MWCLLAGLCGLVACNGKNEIPDSVASTGGIPSVGSGGQSSASGGQGSQDTCDTSSALSLSGCVDGGEMMQDVIAIAQPRPAGSAHWQVVQDLCFERFDSYGLEVERQDYGSGINVIGRHRGTDTARGEIIVAAHYDSVSDCAGADDNGSGVAGVLQAARLLSMLDYGADLVFACFDEEETGLWGSGAYADAAASNSTSIELAISLEMIGYVSDTPNTQTLPLGFEVLFAESANAIFENESRGDFIAMVYDESASKQMEPILAVGRDVSLSIIPVMIPQNDLAAEELSDLRRSDHASFWWAGYPAVMVTDTADFRNPNYHCEAGPDAPSDLNQEFMARVTRSIVSGVHQLAQ